MEWKGLLTATFPGSYSRYLDDDTEGILGKRLSRWMAPGLKLPVYSMRLESLRR